MIEWGKKIEKEIAKKVLAMLVKTTRDVSSSLCTKASLRMKGVLLRCDALSQSSLPMTAELALLPIPTVQGLHMRKSPWIVLS